MNKAIKELLPGEVFSTSTFPNQRYVCDSVRTAAGKTLVGYHFEDDSFAYEYVAPSLSTVKVYN